MFSDALLQSAAELLQLLRCNGLRCATAESCSGGMVGGLLTSISGSSDVFDSGYIVYSERAKIGMLGVDRKLISKYSVYSAEVAEAMATATLSLSDVDFAISTTGLLQLSVGVNGRPGAFVAFATHNKVVVRHVSLLGDDRLENRDLLLRFVMQEAYQLLYYASSSR